MDRPLNSSRHRGNDDRGRGGYHHRRRDDRRYDDRRDYNNRRRYDDDRRGGRYRRYDDGRYDDRRRSRSRERRRESSPPECRKLVALRGQRTDDGQAEFNAPKWNFREPYVNVSAGVSDAASRDRETIRPDVELARFREIKKIRQMLEDGCRDKLFTNLPKMALERWLIEQATVPYEPSKRKMDPLLRKPDDAGVVRREIEFEIPKRIYGMRQRKDIKRLRENLNEYCAAARDWLRRLGTEKNIEDLLQEAEKQSNLAMDESDPIVKADILEKALIMLRDTASPMVRLKVKPVLDELMSSVEKQAQDAVDRLWKMRHETKRDETKQVTLFYPHGERSHFRIGSPVVVKYDEDELYITTGHVLKLRSLYTLRMRRDKSESAKGIEVDESVESEPKGFLDAVYQLVRRYTTFIAKAGQMQAAAPEDVFEAMREDFGVCMESFGSPLNCYFQRFGSAFPDTDVHFGSVGSFFRNEPVEGSFETGPPYVKETMDRMAVRLDKLLAASNRPLSFIVFVPDWYDPPLQAKLTMEASPFLRADLAANGRKHAYVVGNQHIPKAARRRYYSVPHGTRLYWLQNDAGHAKWPPTRKKLQRVLDGLERCQIDSDSAVGKRYDTRFSAGSIRLFKDGKVIDEKKADWGVDDA